MRDHPNSPDPQALSRWLAAEREDGPEAETALFELLEALPLLEPPSGFADRVLLRARLEESLPAAAARPLFGSLWSRAALALCLAVTALSLAWLPQTLAAFSGLWSLNDLVRMGVTAMVDASRLLSLGIGVSHWVLGLGETVAATLVNPVVVKVAAGCLAVSTIAFSFLRDLMTRDRSLSYVDHEQ